MTQEPGPTGSPQTAAAPQTAGPPLTRWEQQFVGERWSSYADRFDQMISDGTDLEGEARFVDALARRDSAILDAGCGTGRIAAALQRMGHRVIGVDKDADLIDIARRNDAGVPYLACDLLLLTPQRLRAAGGPPGFDLIVLPGNVMVYLAPGTEREVLSNLAGMLNPAGRIAAGFATDRDYSAGAFKADAQAVGLTVEHHFATWQLDPADGSSDWAVIVLRGPGPAAAHLD